MKWISRIIKHRNESRITVEFERNEELNQRIRKFEGSRWSSSLRCWHIPDTSANRLRFKVETQIQQVLNNEKLEKIELFQKWLRSKRYSENTLKTYSEALKTFLYYFKDQPIEEITIQDIINFNNDYILKNQFSSSYQNQIVNAVKLFFRTIEGQNLNVDLIHRPKREKTLPNVLSKEEVKLILTATRNLKHSTMLSLIYACGLRRSELLNLKFNDIDSKRKLLIIRQSKGKKDRIVPISDKIITMLRTYYKHYKPETWLFEGEKPNTQYSPKSLQSLLKQCLEKQKITKPVTLHWLRHSYATHLLECGTDLRYIQELLGHNSSRTTEIYTHVSTKNIQNIKSPFDDL